MNLVLLPGMMCDARLFGPQLREHPDAIVVTSTVEDSVSAMAKQVLAIAPETFALAGLSMGGIVAMEIMRIAPGRVTKLALLDTNHRAEKTATRAKRLPQIAAVKAGNLDGIMRNEMKPLYLSNGPQKEKILDLCMSMAIDLGAQAFINQSLALMERRDQTETLKIVTCPSLVLCGAEDQLCPVTTHQDMAMLLPNSTLEIIAEAGHLTTLEKPTETNAALARWLKAA